MDTYPCPKCGGIADEAHGCRSCGRPHDPVAADLARLKQRMAGLDAENRRLADNQSDIRAERARLQEEANALVAQLTEQLSAEAGLAPSTPPRPRPAPPPPLPPRLPPVQRTPARPQPPPMRPAPPQPLPETPETSPRSAQNTLLTLGGFLLGIAAIVFTALFYTTAQTGGRAFVLGVATMVALAMPLLLRQRLSATAETIAGFGLLLVLLDGYAAYFSNLTGLRSVSVTLFSAILLGLVAGVAAAYRLASHLRAPQFAALLAVQPFLPLLAANFHAHLNGFGMVFAIVAALNLGSVALLSQDVSRAMALVRLPGAAPGPGGQSWPRMLRELAWLLFAATLAVAVVLALIGLAQAQLVGAAARSSLVLLLAAAVGVVGGRMSGRANLGHVATGAAALAIIGSASRVNYLVLPQYTLVLTAAVAATIQLASNVLSAQIRRGPSIGSLLGAAATAVVVTIGIVRITAATVHAAVTPRVWAADLYRYADHVRAPSWQVPAAAVLLAILAVSAAPSRRRVDAAAVGGLAVTLALPGTGGLAWWAVPMVATVVSTATTRMALASPDGTSALIRSTVAGLLGIFAVATSLARPELTATTCSLLAFVSAATAFLAARGPTGAYADRVADAAGGAAAFTFPIAVGTFAWLAGTPSTVLVPLTMLATSAGVLAAALSQVATRTPRTGSAGGAMAACVGCVLLAVQARGEVLADLGLGLLLLAAATATAAARAFHLSGSGLLDGVRDIPAAVSAFVDELDTVVDRPEPQPPKRPRISLDGTTVGAALGTAALILALARLLAVAVPGIGLVTTSAMVFLVSVGVLSLPQRWRQGPRIGAGTVGGAIVALTAGAAIVEAAHAIAASTPFWSADLARWTARVAGFAPYGWQVPASLLLAAAASWVLLPRPVGGDLGFVTLALGGLSLPAAFALPWWSPELIAGVFAVVAGVGAALIGPNDPAAAAYRRVGLAGVLGLYATAAAGATSAATGLALSVIVGAGALVAMIATRREIVPPEVPGIASAAALTAGPGAAATLAATGGATRAGVLGSALAMAVFGVLVVVGVRAARVRWGAYPAFGVGTAAFIVACAAAVPDPHAAQVWAAWAALIATVAAGVQRIADPTINRGVTAVVVTTAVPAALLAAGASAQAWLPALVGPYRTLRHVWGGYANAPQPSDPDPAVVTLLLLAVVAAGIAVTLGGYRYLLAAVLPPVAAAAVVLPAAAGAAREVTPWVALAVAVATGLGAALSPPTSTAATPLLRGTAGIVCAVTGGAGVAGSLATRTTTLTSLGIVAVSAIVAATLGRDPGARTVAWIVASAAGFALPPTSLAAAGHELRSAAFGILAMCAVLVGAGWALARTVPRRAEAAVVELCAALGGTFALLLALGSARHAAAVLTIWGLLLGAAALRRDRPVAWRHWLVRAALGAELTACWLLLYSVEVGLPEAYTLPFAAVALLLGAIELRRRSDLSSWAAYGPALAGGFLPSLALVLAGSDPLWRWVSLFAAAVAVVIAGASSGRRAPVVIGAAVAMTVAITEMIRLIIAGAIAGAVLVALAGVVLIAFGAYTETRLRTRRRT